MEIHSFFKVACYGLYTVAEAFQTRAVSTKWLLHKILYAIWKLFKYSPAKRDTHKTGNRFVEVPLSFCKTSWVEDERVAAKNTEI